MKVLNFTRIISMLCIYLAVSVLLSACEGKSPPAAQQTFTDIQLNTPAQEQAVIKLSPDKLNREKSKKEDIQFDIGNTHYLFVVAEHSVEELESLLLRAEQIAETSLDHFNQLDIALVIHGPDIDLFTQSNYEKNKKLIDLAAKLDAFDVLDLKICEISMSNMGVSRDEVPAFIESVPFGPDEIKRLSEDGYINL